MFRRYWIVLVLCWGSIAVAQPNPEHDKMKADAEAAYQQADFAKCKELTSKVLAQNPKDHVAMYLRASSRVELGVFKRDIAELREGIQDARESLKIGGSSEVNYYLPYLYGMIALANMEDKKEHALVAVDVATKNVLNRANLNPEQKANVLYQRAAAYIHLKDLNSAIADYEAAIKSYPAHLGSHVGLAETYNVSGQPDKAVAAFTAAIETFPNNHLVYNNRGLFYQQQGKPQEAVNDFNKALEIDKNFAVAYTDTRIKVSDNSPMPKRISQRLSVLNRTTPCSRASVALVDSRRETPSERLKTTCKQFVCSHKTPWHMPILVLQNSFPKIFLAQPKRSIKPSKLTQKRLDT